MRESTSVTARLIDLVAIVTGFVLAYLAASSVWPDSFVVVRVLGSVLVGYPLGSPIAKLFHAAWGNIQS